MREIIVNKLVEILNNNSGNRLTGELIYGIAASVNQELLKVEVTKQTEVSNETPRKA